MGDLLNEIKSVEVSPVRRSLLHDVLAQMNKTDRADLLAAVNDKSVPAVVVTRVLAKRGFKLPAATINRFRRGEVSLDQFE